MRAIVAFMGVFLTTAMATGAVAASEQAGQPTASPSIFVQPNSVQPHFAEPSFSQLSQVVGVTDGNLAALALAHGDYPTAARRLKAQSPDGINDPARLINLGNAYAGMGRYAKAREIYTSARYAPDTMLVLADGSEASSRDIADKALGRMGLIFASR